MPRVTVLDAMYRELSPLVAFHGCSIILVTEGSDHAYGNYWLKGNSYSDSLLSGYKSNKLSWLQMWSDSFWE